MRKIPDPRTTRSRMTFAILHPLEVPSSPPRPRLVNPQKRLTEAVLIRMTPARGVPAGGLRNAQAQGRPEAELAVGCRNARRC